MAFIPTTDPPEASDAVATMYRRQQSSWGYVPNYAKVFCHRPDVMARWAELLSEIRRPMDARRFEIVTFAAAHELRNSPCTLAHGLKLREFLSEEDIVALVECREVSSLSDAEEAMACFARLVARDASQVTSADVDRLAAHGLKPAEVFDIAAAVAGRAFFTKLLDALGVEADSPFLNLDTTLQRALSVGRPIDTRPCTRIAAADVR